MVSMKLLTNWPSLYKAIIQWYCLVPITLQLLRKALEEDHCEISIKYTTDLNDSCGIRLRPSKDNRVETTALSMQNQFLQTRSHSTGEIKTNFLSQDFIAFTLRPNQIFVHKIICLSLSPVLGFFQERNCMWKVWFLLSFFPWLLETARKRIGHITQNVRLTNTNTTAQRNRHFLTPSSSHIALKEKGKNQQKTSQNHERQSNTSFRNISSSKNRMKG